MEVKLSRWQTQVWDDTHRFKVIACGRRAGKTTLAALKMIDFAIQNDNVNVWYISPTYRQSEQIMWRMLKTYIPSDSIHKTNDTKLSIILKNKSIIELKGADADPDALRGVRIDYLICDEVASFKNWKVVWHEVLRPTLIDSRGHAMFIGTPKGYNHFYDLYNETDLDYKSYTFTSYDNPFVPSEEIDKARLELTEDTFYQEFMADFRKFTGLAHKEWDRTIHLIDPFDVPKEWQRARGFDYGSAHYTASCRVAIDHNDNWFLENSYFDNRKDIKGHADAIKGMDYGFGFIPSWGDPSGAQWFTEFQHNDLTIQPANKEVGQGARGWVEYGVERINQRLKPVQGHRLQLQHTTIENSPKFFVLNTENNQPFVKQIENIKWKETSTGEVIPILDESGDPTGGHYDLMAALRYLVVSYTHIQPSTTLQIRRYNNQNIKKWGIS